MDGKCRNSFVMDSKLDGFKAKWIHQIEYFEYKAIPYRNDAPKLHIMVTHALVENMVKKTTIVCSLLFF